MSYRLIVAGPKACFRRSEMAVDFVTYDVITPMAARGIFESVHWTPAITWQISRIKVLSPIRSEWCSPEAILSSASSTSLPKSTSLYLTDVRYLIEARFEMTSSAGPRDNAAQHADMFRKRLSRQRFFRRPYLGQRHLAATLRLLDDGEDAPSCYVGQGERDLGWMLYDLDPAHDYAPKFYRPTMCDGVIDLLNFRLADLPS